MQLRVIKITHQKVVYNHLGTNSYILFITHGRSFRFPFITLM